MKTRKIVDWIKVNNLKEATRNYSALTGLKRVNNIIKFIFKMTIGGAIIYIPLVGFLNDVDNVLKNGSKNFFKKINAIPNKEKLFHNAHYKSILNYHDDDEFENKETELGIYDYRRKLFKNASGLVLETCKIYKLK
jgi:hypothetical protein